MPYRPGTVARWVLALALPVAGGALASYGELVWGAAAVAALLALPPLRPYAAPASVAFGLLVLARIADDVIARGAVAVLLGVAAVVAAAYVVSLTRRKGADAPSNLQWVAALAAAAAVTAAGAATLAVRPATLNLVLAPVAAAVALGAVPASPRLSRAAVVALTAGLALGAARGGVSFGLARAADDALARGDYAAAGAYARYAVLTGAGARAELTRLKAAAEVGAPWPELEALAAESDRFTSPRPFDAALATAAFAREDYDKAAMYGDLATTPSPTSPVRDRPIPRADVYDAFVDRSEGPFPRAWADLWAGEYAKAAAAFARLAPTDPGARLNQALALELAGDREAAAAIYEDMWRGDHGRLRAGFGLFRTRRYRGLRGEIWRSLIRRYPNFWTGAKLDATDGFPLTKRRRSLGRKPATFTFGGAGRRAVVVIAESYGASGLYPIVTLDVNGAPVHTFYMNVPGENIYRGFVEFGPGEKRIGLTYENDYADPGRGLDRNVYLREVRIGGEKESR
jgi:tetratricopeptide (TPR) repeat protein